MKWGMVRGERGTDGDSFEGYASVFEKMQGSERKKRRKERSCELWRRRSVDPRVTFVFFPRQQAFVNL